MVRRRPETRLEKADRLLANLGFIMLFAKVSDADLAAIAIAIRDQLKE